MQAQFRPPINSRINSFHTPKRQLLGSRAGHAAPAWRVGNTAPGPHAGAGAKDKGKAVDPGSKILLSRLPSDVGETEVEELFKKTVGPVKEAFIIYNSQGNSKGMAIVSFQRASDAAVAKSKYDGKIVDGRRPIKMEIVTDTVNAARPPPASASPSLLNRLGGVTNIKVVVNGQSAHTDPAVPTQPRHHHAKPVPAHHDVPGDPSRKRRQKKGPRRIKKSVAQLDKEMEDYRAAAVEAYTGIKS